MVAGQEGVDRAVERDGGLLDRPRAVLAEEIGEALVLVEHGLMVDAVDAAVLQEAGDGV